MIADLFQGTPFALTLVLTTSNFLYVVTTFALYMFLINILRQPIAVIPTFLFGLCGVGSVVGALFAATFVPMFNTKFMIGGLLDEFGYWFTSELQNALLLLPIILNIPQYSQVKHYFSRNRGLQPTDLLPFGAVLISIAASYYDSGPGSSSTRLLH